MPELLEGWSHEEGAVTPFDGIVDYVNHWTDRADLPICQLLGWLGLGASKFHD